MSCRLHSTHDVTKLAGPIGWNFVDELNADVHTSTDPAPYVIDDLRFDAGLQVALGNDLDADALARLLHYLERRDARQVAQDVDQREAVHDGAVLGHDEIGRCGPGSR